MLTGDKRETAVNIAYACKLLEPDDKIFTLKSQSRVCRKLRFFFSIYGEGVWFSLPKKMQSDNIAGQYRKIIYFLFFHLTKDSMIYWKMEILEN